MIQTVSLSYFLDVNLQQSLYRILTPEVTRTNEVVADTELTQTTLI
jgi:hypothetical protein